MATRVLSLTILLALSGAAGGRTLSNELAAGQGVSYSFDLPGTCDTDTNAGRGVNGGSSIGAEWTVRVRALASNNRKVPPQDTD